VGRCVDGNCRVTPLNCDDGDVCTIDVCNPASGECDHQTNLDCGCTTDSECPDDANPCTDPHCQIPGGQTFGICTFRASTLGCDDGNPCTSGEVCTAVGAPRFAVCAGGTAVSCDDLNPATFDWCDPVGTPFCRNEAVVPCPNGQGDCPPPSGCYAFQCDGDPANPVCQPTARTGSCDDGNYCTVQESCTAGVCGGGTPRDCDDGRPETIDSCDPVARACSHILDPGSVPCVTAQDCIATLGPPSNTCRQWLCPLGFCRDVQVPDETSCEDGLYCTANDTCQRGVCTAGLPRDCSDSDPLTECVCIEDAKACRCSETFPCGTGCTTGSDCDDGDPCTTDSCITFVTPSVCTCTPRDACSCNPSSADGGAAACDDGKDETIDACVPNTNPSVPHAGLCTHEFRLVCQEPCAGLNDDAACADTNKCTVDLCEPSNAENSPFCCVHVAPLPGAVCGRPCTTAAQCSDNDRCTPDRCGTDGTCDPPGPPIANCCATDDDCPEDNNPCTTRRCDLTNGQCGFVNNQAVCDDANACTLNDACLNGSCVGETRDCNDGNPCTQNLCDPVQGCQNPLVPNPPAECIDCRITPGACDDEDPCTTDTCDAGGRCQHADVNAGEETALCIPLGCRDQVDCDDGNPCTTDQCLGAGGSGPRACLYNETAGCQIPASLTCGGAAECDPADCIPDNPGAFCNSVTTDCPTPVCDPDTGCRFLPSDACPTFECTPQNAYETCWDRNPCTLDECLPDYTCVPAGQPRPSALPADSLYRACLQCETVADCPSTGEFALDDPCITVECRKPERMHPGDTLGVCHAFVDQAKYPNRCEDFDLCTLDTCLPGGGCGHVPRNADCGLCFIASDCDDRNPCTEDACVVLGRGIGFSCRHTAIGGCTPCANSGDCGATGGSFCANTLLCKGGVCAEINFAEDISQGPLCFPGTGCTTVEDCGTIEGAIAICSVEAGGDCVFLPVPPQCSSVNECVPSRPCQRATACTAGQCVFGSIPGCVPQACTASAQCDDGKTCNLDVCSGGFCLHIGNDCCESATDCDGRLDPPWQGDCRTRTCGPTGQCEVVPLGGGVTCGDYCETDAECARRCEERTDPATGESQGEVCQNFCLVEATCSAQNPCARGTCDIPAGQTQGFCRVCYDWPCAEGACSTTGRCVWFTGDCTGCSADGECVDSDPCTIDTCVNGRCAHAPAPACTPIACDADTICDSGDVCSVGVCLSGTCVFLPHPACE
jgi:hypothetical protein